MNIHVKRINNAVNLKATNEDGASIVMDGSPSIGGENLGMRPMQVLLSSLGGCTSMDVLSILTKMQQKVSAYEVLLDGEREPDVTPSLFKNIHLKFILKGDNLEDSKVQRAIELSMTKYCSVSKTLEPTCNITWSYEIVK
ncbi:MAG: OsmC family protein [Cytophagales bacterium]|nr:OsmC family protein [Cytophagales bacterium]